MTMGEKILNMRKARGWSQEELADRVGVSRQAVSRWESGSAKPDADKIIVICDLFGISADYLLRDSYSGEIGQTSFPERKESELGKFFRGMSLKQWAGLGLFLLGLLITLTLKIVFACLDTTYSMGITDIFGYTRQYFGFEAFLRIEEILGLWYGACAAMPAGIVLMLWNRIKSWNLPERIRKVFQKLLLVE